MMDKQTKHKWLRRAIVACLLIGMAVVAAFKWEDCLRALIYHRLVQYSTIP